MCCPRPRNNFMAFDAASAKSNGRAKSLHSLSHGPGGTKPATIP